MTAPTGGEIAVYASKDKSAQARIKVGLDYPALPQSKSADFSTTLSTADFATSWLTAAPAVDSNEIVFYSRGYPPYEWVRPREHWFPADLNQPFRLTWGVKYPQTDPVYSPVIIVGTLLGTLADSNEPVMMYQQGSASTDLGAMADYAEEGDIQIFTLGAEQGSVPIAYTASELVFTLDWDPLKAVNSNIMEFKQGVTTIYAGDPTAFLLPPSGRPRPFFIQFGWPWETQVARVTDAQLTTRSRSYSKGDAIPALGSTGTPVEVMRITQFSVATLGSEPYESRTYPEWIRERSRVTNGTFNSNITGWAAVGSATPTQDTGIRREGAGAMKVVTTGGGANEGAGRSSSDAVSASTEYTISCFFRQEASGSVIIRAAEYNAADSFLTSQSSSAIDLTTATGNDGWTHQTYTFTTGASTAGVRLQFLTSGTAAITFYVDEAMLELGDTATLSEENNETWAIIPANKLESFQVRRTRAGMGDDFSISLMDDGGDGFDTQRWNERPVLIDTKVGTAAWKRQIAGYALSYVVARTPTSLKVSVRGKCIATYRLDTFLNRSYYGADSVGDNVELDAVNIGYNIGEIIDDLIEVSNAMHGSPLGNLDTTIQAISIIPYNISTGGHSLLQVFTTLFDQCAQEYWLAYTTSGSSQYGNIIGNAWDLGSGTADHTFALEEAIDWRLVEDVEAAPGQVSYRQNFLVDDYSGRYSILMQLPTTGTSPTLPYPVKAPVLTDSLSFAKSNQVTAFQVLLDENGSNYIGGVAPLRMRLEATGRRMATFTVVAQDWLEPSDEVAVTSAPGQLSGETWVVDSLEISGSADSLTTRVVARTSDWLNAILRSS